MEFKIINPDTGEDKTYTNQIIAEFLIYSFRRIW